jgi:hypothetical protein
MRILSIVLALLSLLGSARATTLQKMGLDEIARKSTVIVRARVLGSAGAVRGQDIYTFYQLQVVEDLRATGRRQVEVAVPGGAARGLRQIVSGAPRLNPGEEYVFFLWTSPSGLTQVIGLSQGLLSVQKDVAGNPVVARPPTSELMLDKNGRPVSDQAVWMQLTELRARIQSALSTGK